MILLLHAWLQRACIVHTEALHTKMHTKLQGSLVVFSTSHLHPWQFMLSMLFCVPSIVQV